MFRAIGKLFKALGYLITGRIDDARKVLMLNPNVIQANYDEIISEKKSRLATYKKAVAGLIATQETKMEKLRNTTEAVQKHEKLKAGAAAKAKGIVAAIGNNPEAVRTNGDYIKCQAAYRDFSSTLEEKQKMVAELEQDVKHLQTQIDTHGVSITSLLREIDNLGGEKHEAVAEIISSKQEKEIADMLSGASEDKTNKELQDLRDVRRQARAEARVSREVAGVSAKQSEDEFLNFANSTTADTEFEKMVGLSQTSPLLEAVIQATQATQQAQSKENS
jgi:hypothetical protein